MIFFKVLQKADFLKYAIFTMYNPEYYGFLGGEEIEFLVISFGKCVLLLPGHFLMTRKVMEQ